MASDLCWGEWFILWLHFALLILVASLNSLISNLIMTFLTVSSTTMHCAIIIPSLNRDYIDIFVSLVLLYPLCSYLISRMLLIGAANPGALS